jgi:hypothetical protein
MSNLVHNERVKYLATWMSNLGVGGVIAGLIAPTFAMVDYSAFARVAFALAGGFMGVSTLVMATLILGDLRE